MSRENIEEAVASSLKDVGGSQASHGISKKIRQAFTKALAAGLAVFSAVPALQSFIPEVEALETSGTSEVKNLLGERRDTKSNERKSESNKGKSLKSVAKDNLALALVVAYGAKKFAKYFHNKNEVPHIEKFDSEKTIASKLCKINKILGNIEIKERNVMFGEITRDSDKELNNSQKEYFEKVLRFVIIASKASKRLLGFFKKGYCLGLRNGKFGFLGNNLPSKPLSDQLVVFEKTIREFSRKIGAIQHLIKYSNRTEEISYCTIDEKQLGDLTTLDLFCDYYVKQVSEYLSVIKGKIKGCYPADDDGFDGIKENNLENLKFFLFDMSEHSDLHSMDENPQHEKDNGLFVIE